MPPTPTRLVAGAAAVLLTALALTGCTAGSSSDGGCTPQARPGTASDAVSATGRFGTAPRVRFPAPLHTTTTEVSAVRSGTGTRIVAPSQVVSADLTFVNATSGAVLQRTPYGSAASAATFVLKEFFSPGVRAAMRCARAGDRIAAVVPPKQVAAAGQRIQGLAAGDSLVAVVDVRRAYPSRADGRDQVMGSGLPAVVLGPDGRPGITLPEGGAGPRQDRVADLKTGSGAVVRRGDRLVVQYTGVAWQPGGAENGTVFGSTWSAGAPTAVTVDPAQLGPGLVAALTGRRIGSQVLAVLPPARAAGSQTVASPPSGAAGVFVLDLLGKV